MKHVSIALVTWALVDFSSCLVHAGEQTFDAARLEAEAILTDVRRAPDRPALELSAGVLIEDDGPAAGYSYRPNEERLAQGAALRKQLVLDKPGVRTATLLIGGKGNFTFTCNGAPWTATPLGPVGNYWQAFAVPASLLRAGTNDIVLRGTGQIWIARDDEYAAGSTERPSHPNRSAKSTDDGQTWDDRRLGPKGDIDGEYYVRLFLDQRRASGRVMLPVVDLARDASAPIGPAIQGIAAARIDVDATLAESTQLTIHYRTSPEPHVSSGRWSSWQTVAGPVANVSNPSGRYLHVELRLATDDAATSPQLRKVTLSAQTHAAASWHEALKLLERREAPRPCSSIPFTYEPLDHPRLSELRQTERLDEVVRGAKSELEQIARLAAWSAGKFSHGGHLSKLYPAWDALQILAPHADGTPVGGFCQQYNVVFLQACESLGIVGRAVSIGPGSRPFPVRGGHEVVELWSNEHAKWIYVDGNMAWYAVDAESRVPLSLWELRARQLDVLDGQTTRSIEVIRLREMERKWTSLTDWPPLLELRMIPRSNFLAERAPLPLNQGMRGWFWTGHHVWTDARAPAALLYGERVERRVDWEWPVNTTHLTCEASAEPGTLRVFADTQTPSWETFVARYDDGPALRVGPSFDWPLRAGRNRLDVRSRNKLGREGPPTVYVVER